MWRLGGALDWVSGTLDGIWLAGWRAGWGLAGAGWEAGWPQGFPGAEGTRSEGGKRLFGGPRKHQFHIETHPPDQGHQTPETRTRD